MLLQHKHVRAALGFLCCFRRAESGAARRNPCWPLVEKSGYGKTLSPRTSSTPTPPGFQRFRARLRSIFKTFG
uniref:Putative secreted protein n=1 Tax=Anopheles marajoara TaxID=58244 RepID=A0A2M4CDJ5_9DIPT